MSQVSLQLLTFLRHPEIAHRVLTGCFLFWAIKCVWGRVAWTPRTILAQSHLCSIQASLLFREWPSLKVLRWKLKCLLLPTLLNNKYLGTTQHQILSLNSLGDNRYKTPQIDILHFPEFLTRTDSRAQWSGLLFGCLMCEVWGQSPGLQTSPKPLSHTLDLAGVAVVKTDQEVSCCSAEKGQPLPVLVIV